MKEKIRGSVYGIGLAVALFALISISVLPASTMSTYKDDGGSNEAAISAEPTSDVKVINDNFVLETTLNPGSDGDGCACYCGQGIVMHDSGDYIDHVVKLTAYREQENEDSFNLITHSYEGYTTSSRNGYITRTDTWYYELERNAEDYKWVSGEYSASYTYYSPIK